MAFLQSQVVLSQEIVQNIPLFHLKIVQDNLVKRFFNLLIFERKSDIM